MTEYNVVSDRPNRAFLVEPSNHEYLSKRIDIWHNKTSQCSFDSLPEPIQLYIFSMLDSWNLLKVCEVCRTWERLGSDEVLWRKKLSRDVKKWNVLGNSFNPDTMLNMSYKEVYMSCCPSLKRQKLPLMHQITKALRSLAYMINKKVPKLAMFGPGLESKGTKLVRNLLQDRTNLFEFISLFPGRFEGVGGGIRLNLNPYSLEFDLITLYTTNQNERETRSATERALQNRLFANQEQTKLQKAIKDLCKTLDGLIYVVDAHCTDEDLLCGLPELLALSNEILIPSQMPLLVLLCSKAGNIQHRSSIDVIRLLQLSKLTRPWQKYKKSLTLGHQC
ncbi:hypothetical protein HELRODRAFT_170819 [Helobdella robusta]|uniref:F-box domain-containing protein n=1 Tax=Helobdella robusta TaxID=6412 RepID=T1F3G9_HELRO|nr:hypothetical protein HELRODRAFT_170819 [Helobdella robusta]ESO06798.1 hypothetical protein HELRODRAFT_170819 [Helobdella robusta]